MLEASFPDIELPGGWCEETVEFSGRSLRLHIAAEPDRILDCLVAGEEVPRAFQDPYWAKLWPASRQLSAFLQTCASTFSPGTRCLELGCGSGLPGLALLALGCDVTFSDYVPEAVRLAHWNAARNGLAPRESLLLDWNCPPAVRVYDVLVGSDLLYDATLHQPLLLTIRRMLAEQGRCWLADPGRAAVGSFLDQAILAGFWIDCFDASGKLTTAPGLNDFRVFELSLAQN